MLRLQYLTGAIAGFKFAPLRLPSSGCYNLRAVIYWVGFGDGARCISLRNPFSREFSEGTANAFFAKVGFGCCGAATARSAAWPNIPEWTSSILIRN